MSFYKRAGQATVLILCSHFLTACSDVGANVNVPTAPEQDAIKKTPAQNSAFSSSPECPDDRVIKDLSGFLLNRNEEIGLILAREDGSSVVFSSEVNPSSKDEGSWSYIEQRPGVEHACILDNGKGAAFVPGVERAKNSGEFQLVQSPTKKATLTF